ncbi:hypothetical protein DL95DRAFT_382284, partial [Leptodontidium sp. 2 PMI_412]
MGGLKAATVSNQIVRKRKRKHDESERQSPAPSDAGSEEAGSEASTSTSTIATKTHDGGAKPRRTPKAKQPSKLSRNNSSMSNAVTSAVPWPTSFQLLDKTHRALNLVFTFCSTRKHLAT